MTKQPQQSQLAKRLLIGTGIAALGGLALIYGLNASAAAPGHDASTAPAAAVREVRPTAWTQPANLADLVENVSPAVVQITATGHVNEMASMSGGQIPDEMLEGPFGEFFRRFFDEEPGGAFRGRRYNDAPERAAIGSGFIIDESGVVVTNNHVVDGAQTFKVALKDGREFSATLLGADDRTDLAVLKIDTAQHLPTIRWGDSDHVRVGDPVFAVGAPYGLSGTVTSGIVSARGREIGAGPYDDFIQIDAPINQGNSGGPLFNAYGEVVGVNTAIFSPSGGNVGIGFSIPSALADSVVNQIVSHGGVTRGWLGAQIQTVSADIADSLGLKSARGAIVANVEDASPAAKAGVKDGDVILKFNGKAVENAGDLSRAVADAPTDKTAKLEIVRDGRQRVLTARIEKLQTTEARATGRGPDRSMPDYDALGLSFEATDNGVVVAGVDPESPAARTGLRPGDALLAINQRSVVTVKDVEAAIKEAQSKGRPSILAQIKRDGEEALLVIPFPQT